MNIRYDFFLIKNPYYLDNPVFKSFIEEEENRVIFIKKLFNYKDYPSILDQKIRKHYFEIRFTSYVCTHLYYEALHFDKKTRTRLNKEQLILDQPINDKEGNTLKDILEAPKDIEMNSISNNINAVVFLAAIYLETSNISHGCLVHSECGVDPLKKADA